MLNILKLIVIYVTLNSNTCSRPCKIKALQYKLTLILLSQDYIQIKIV
jgi:hypothetical protein